MSAVAQYMAQYRTLREWIDAGEGRPLFERMHQINWFIRKHREELIRSGTFVPGRGGRPILVTAQFGETITGILKREHEAEAAEGSASA